MSKNKRLRNRLEDLFTGTEPLPPEPDGSFYHPLESTPEQDRAELPLDSSQPIGVEPSVQPARTGWDDFLDAIHRQEHIGFRYEGLQSDQITRLSFPLRPDTSRKECDQILNIPLQIGSQDIGLLEFEKDNGALQTEVIWSSEEQNLAKTLASRIAMHIDNLRLLEQAERYRIEAEEAARRLTREGWESFINKQQETYEGYQYDQDQVVPLETETLDEPAVKQELKIREEAIGELALAEIDLSNPGAIDLLNIVADRLSTHIENLRLLDETENSRRQLDKRAAELETVARVSTAAASILEPAELLGSVVNLTASSFNLYHAHIYLIQPDKDALILTAASGEIGQQILAEGELINLDQVNALPVQSAKDRKALIVQDTHDLPQLLIHPRLQAARSELAVPMVIGDELLGVFDVLASNPQRFSDEDVLTFTTLAAQTAVALRNAQLYAEQMITVERLRELDDLKSAFLANMSHELRTPLNSILGFAQVILEGLDGPLTENMTTDLELIDKNGKHLLRLISDVLDMAKIEAGRMNLSPDMVNLREILDEATSSTSSLARDKGLYLVMADPTTADFTFIGDRVRITQIFINLIGNATKFTETGGITITTERLDKVFRVHIHDTGIGIPKEKLESIFEAFSQVDTTTTRKAGGTGLGLPISRRMAELHGGKLWAESSNVPGEGSTFILELPYAGPSD